MDFANRLIDLRKKNGWSQEDLAYKVDVSRQAVSKWENGASIPDMNNLKKLSEVFNVSLDELITGKVEAKEEQTNIVEKNSDNIEKIVYDKHPFIVYDKRKTINKKKLIKIIAIIFSVILISYIILCTYRFFILKDINDKFNSIKNENNYYIEKDEVYVDGNNITPISKTKVWYKDGIMKKCIEKYEGEMKSYILYIDFNKKEKYVLDSCLKNYTIMKSKIDENIIRNIKTEFYSYNSILDSLNIFKINIKKDNEYYIVENKYKKTNKQFYNIDTGIINKKDIRNEKMEENIITYKIEFDKVINEEEIKMNNLDMYTIKEVNL